MTTESTEETKVDTKAKVEKIQQNGVTRPKDGTKTVIVWEQADAISAAQQSPARRKDVIEACLKKDVNAATAATQYGRWRKFHGLKGSDEPQKSAEVPTEAPASDVTTESEPSQG